MKIKAISYAREPLLTFWYIFSQASSMHAEYKLISLLHISLLIIMSYLASIILLRVLREALPRLLGILKIWKCFDFLVHLLLMCSISLILFFFFKLMAAYIFFFCLFVCFFYNTVLPYIDMNPPQAYMSSQF